MRYYADKDAAIWMMLISILPLSFHEGEKRHSRPLTAKSRRHGDAASAKFTPSLIGRHDAAARWRDYSTARRYYDAICGERKILIPARITI